MESPSIGPTKGWVVVASLLVFAQLVLALSMKSSYPLTTFGDTSQCILLLGALAEQDEIKRNGMLLAADRFLKRTNQQSLVLGRTRNRREGKGKEPRQLVQPKHVVETGARN